MGPAAFVIAIMGCADGGTACTAIETLPAEYHSEAACVAAAPAVLYRGGDYDFPTIVAQCQARASSLTASRAKMPRGNGGQDG